MIPVFLSYPKPFLPAQEVFIKNINDYLKDRGIESRTLGVNEYDMEVPLTSIRRIISESHGLISIALRKTYASGIASRPGELFKEPSDDSEEPLKTYEITDSNIWFTSPWCQIETAMAFQVGLPILILREKGVYVEGILEKGAIGLYMPEIDFDSSENFFSTTMWRDLIGQWEGYIRTVVKTKGNPPKLY